MSDLIIFVEGINDYIRYLPILECPQEFSFEVAVDNHMYVH